MGSPAARLSLTKDLVQGSILFLLVHKERDRGRGCIDKDFQELSLQNTELPTWWWERRAGRLEDSQWCLSLWRGWAGRLGQPPPPRHEAGPCLLRATEDRSQKCVLITID